VTGLAPATSAPGLGSALPRLHRGWAYPPATFAPGRGSPLPHLHQQPSSKRPLGRHGSVCPQGQHSFGFRIRASDGALPHHSFVAWPHRALDRNVSGTSANTPSRTRIGTTSRCAHAIPIPSAPLAHPSASTQTTYPVQCSQAPPSAALCPSHAAMRGT
jgi:hypothetical protein